MQINPYFRTHRLSSENAIMIRTMMGMVYKDLTLKDRRFGKMRLTRLDNRLIISCRPKGEGTWIGKRKFAIWETIR